MTAPAPRSQPDSDSAMHQSQLAPAHNKFHKGNGDDGKHYWLTPWQDPAFVKLAEESGPFDFDPCPYPRPDGFDGLTCEWGVSSYVNPPFGSIMKWKTDSCTRPWGCGVSVHRKGVLISAIGMLILIGVSKSWSLAFSYFGLAVGLSISAVFAAFAYELSRKDSQP